MLLAVKSQQTQAAIDDLATAAPPGTPVVSLQNGVANERSLLRRVAHVHGVCVMMPASHLRPGEVILHSANRPGLLDVGRFPDGVDEVDEQVAADLVGAGFASLPGPTSWPGSTASSSATSATASTPPAWTTRTPPSWSDSPGPRASRCSWPPGSRSSPPPRTGAARGPAASARGS